MLLKKTSVPVCTSDADDAFHILKQKLTTTPILVRPDFDRPFILFTDALAHGLGAILSQKDDDGAKHVIAYASHGIHGSEENYGVTKLECLAVIWAIKHFRCYLVGMQFDLVTDHSALRGLMNSPNPMGIFAQWIAYLAEFTFTVIYRPGHLNANADFLSRLCY